MALSLSSGKARNGRGSSNIYTHPECTINPRRQKTPREKAPHAAPQGEESPALHFALKATKPWFCLRCLCTKSGETWISLFIHPTIAICPFPAAREQRALLLLPHLDFPEFIFPKPGDLGRVAAPGDPRGSASTGWMPKTQFHVLLLERTLVEFVSLKPFKHLAQQKAAQDRGCGNCSAAQVSVKLLSVQTPLFPAFQHQPDFPASLFLMFWGSFFAKINPTICGLKYKCMVKYLEASRPEERNHSSTQVKPHRLGNS